MGLLDSEIQSLNKSRKRAVYWREVGDEWVATAPLPADPMSIQHYLSKGFRANKPANGGTPKKDEVGETLSCPECEFIAKSSFGLQAHQKKHK